MIWFGITDLCYDLSWGSAEVESICLRLRALSHDRCIESLHRDSSVQPAWLRWFSTKSSSHLSRLFTFHITGRNLKHCMSPFQFRYSFNACPRSITSKSTERLGRIRLPAGYLDHDSPQADPCYLQPLCQAHGSARREGYDAEV
jgi:hypothetical protein